MKMVKLTKKSLKRAERKLEREEMKLGKETDTMVKKIAKKMKIENLKKYEEIKSRIKKLKVIFHQKLDAMHAVEEEIQDLKKRKQKYCPHVKTRVRTDSYMEEGRMSHPVEWEEEICCSCGKVVAHTEMETKVTWHKNLN